MVHRQWVFSGSRRFGIVAGSGLLLLLTAGCPSETGEAGGGGYQAAGGNAAAGGSTSTSNGGTGGGGAEGGGGAASVPTHVGLLSIQDMSIHSAPQAGHGLTVQAAFTPAKAPDYEELPGQPLGCKGWVYDLATAPPPVAEDQGVIEISGVAGGAISCSFQEGAGYICPTASGSGSATLTPGANGTATFELAGASFSADDVGRYLKLSGATVPANNGAFPIVAAPTSSSVVLVHPQAQADDMMASYVVLAGAGPIPNNPNDPIEPGDEITVSLIPGGGMDFQFDSPGPIVAGEPFEIDAATDALLGAIPLDGSVVTLGCSGTGGNCGPAQLTIVRITTTDGDTSGLPPFRMPEPVKRQVDLLCAALGGAGTLVVPEGAMALLQDAHAVSSITRIRTALMREGYVLVQNAAPLPPNPMRILAGHGILGFTSP